MVLVRGYIIDFKKENQNMDYQEKVLFGVAILAVAWALVWLSHGTGLKRRILYGLMSALTAGSSVLLFVPDDYYGPALYAMTTGWPL
jgi:hypothetical protein